MLTGGNATCRTFERHIAVLVAHPIYGAVVFALRCVQIAVVYQIESAPSIWHIVECCRRPNAQQTITAAAADDTASSLCR